MGKLLKDHEKICWPPQLGSAVLGDDDRRTPGDPKVLAKLVLAEVLEPMPDEKCVLVRCDASGGQGSRAPITLSFGVKEMALQKPLFKFLSNQRRKTVEQIGETEVDF